MKVSECRALSFSPESCACSSVGQSLIKHGGFQRPLLHSAGSRRSCSERSCSALLFIYYPSCFPLFSNPVIFCNPFTRHHLHQIIWRCIVSRHAWCLRRGVINWWSDNGSKQQSGWWAWWKLLFLFFLFFCWWRSWEITVSDWLLQRCTHRRVFNLSLEDVAMKNTFLKEIRPGLTHSVSIRPSDKVPCAADPQFCNHPPSGLFGLHHKTPSFHHSS